MTLLTATTTWNSFLPPNSLQGYVTMSSPRSTSNFHRNIVTPQPPSQLWKRLGWLHNKMLNAVRQPIDRQKKKWTVCPWLLLHLGSTAPSALECERSSRSGPLLILGAAQQAGRLDWPPPAPLRCKISLEAASRTSSHHHMIPRSRSLWKSKGCCWAPEPGGTIQCFDCLSSAGSTLLAPASWYRRLPADQHSISRGEKAQLRAEHHCQSLSWTGLSVRQSHKLRRISKKNFQAFHWKHPLSIPTLLKAVS